MRYDSIVVGAGIIGLSIGWRASQLGMSVLVLDRSDPPDGASTVAAGMLAPVTEATFGEDALLRLNLESARRWPGFAEELTMSTGVHLSGHEPGILHLALDRDQSEALRRLFDYQQSLGLKAEWLTSSACRRLEPGLHPSTRAGILAHADAAVDPRQVVEALRGALKAAGGELRLGHEVAGVAGGSSPGARLATGETIAAGTVVVAAGSWSGRLPGIPSYVGKAIRPVKGQILRLRQASPLPSPVTHVLRTEEVYLVPRPGGEVVVGATVEEKGFDPVPTAGGVFELLRAAGELLPGIREMELAEVTAGLRPGTPDNAPLLGTVAPGLVVATGHYRNGVLLAPVTADGIAGLLAKGELPEELAGFAPDRFDR
ncbi:MAG TPA: glycine oxidase ThiO [Actinomycetota bacterium]|nr:glycine oxidase ThiO [Actinomycetota bacterium]